MRLQIKCEMAKDGWRLRTPIVCLLPIITTLKQTPKLVHNVSIGVLTCHCLLAGKLAGHYADHDIMEAYVSVTTWMSVSSTP